MMRFYAYAFACCWHAHKVTLMCSSHDTARSDLIPFSEDKLKVHLEVWEGLEESFKLAPGTCWATSITVFVQQGYGFLNVMSMPGTKKVSNDGFIAHKVFRPFPELAHCLLAIPAAFQRAGLDFL